MAQSLGASRRQISAARIRRRRRRRHSAASRHIKEEFRWLSHACGEDLQVFSSRFTAATEATRPPRLAVGPWRASCGSCAEGAPTPSRTRSRRQRPQIIHYTQLTCYHLTMHRFLRNKSEIKRESYYKVHLKYMCYMFNFATGLHLTAWLAIIGVQLFTGLSAACGTCTGTGLGGLPELLGELLLLLGTRESTGMPFTKKGR